MHSTPLLVDHFLTQKVIVTHVACGQHHTACVTSPGGKLWTFGSGKYGQLGHNSRLDERFPRRVESCCSSISGATLPAAGFISVSCGDRHTAALSDAGHIFTTGCGSHGQLGHANT